MKIPRLTDIAMRRLNFQRKIGDGTDYDKHAANEEEKDAGGKVLELSAGNNHTKNSRNDMSRSMYLTQHQKLQSTSLESLGGSTSGMLEEPYINIK